MTDHRYCMVMAGIMAILTELSEHPISFWGAGVGATFFLAAAVYFLVQEGKGK